MLQRDTHTYVVCMPRDATPDQAARLPDSTRPLSPILDEPEAARRKLLLAELQIALAQSGVQCVLAGNHRLVLRYNQVPLDPSGLTNPTLHILAQGWTRTATTDGTIYRLDTGEEFPASSPAAAAARICSSSRTLIRRGPPDPPQGPS